MLQPHLDALMRISINAPSFTMIDLNEVCSIWQKRPVEEELNKSVVIDLIMVDDNRKRFEDKTSDAMVNSVRRKR
jgi:hypothetical protein